MVAQFFFCCPNTGLNVQGWKPDDREENQDVIVAVLCIACDQKHHVLPEKGKVLGSSDPD